MFVRKGIVRTAIFQSVEVALVGKVARQWDQQPEQAAQLGLSLGGKRVGVLSRLLMVRLASQLVRTPGVVRSNKQWLTAYPNPVVRPAKSISPIIINALQ